MSRRLVCMMGMSCPSSTPRCSTASPVLSILMLCVFGLVRPGAFVSLPRGSGARRMHHHVHLEPLELALELEEQSKLEYEGKVFLALHESHEVVSLNFVIKVANAFCLVHKSNFKSVYPLLFCDVKLLILNLSTWNLSDRRLVSCHSSLI